MFSGNNPYPSNATYVRLDTREPVTKAVVPIGMY